ncbi:MAG TPA: hypothetical protein VHY33_04430 [Thermoanaerobaculia bacterium]|jgi:hypothetical protein|nr:hypothetical protein [Thermoanaerobaculia bacterium]
MRKQAIIFLLIAAVALPSFALATPAARQTQTSADVELENRVTQVIYEKFGRVAPGIGVEVHNGNVILNGRVREVVSLQVENRVCRVKGVKSARWVPVLIQISHHTHTPR